MGRRNAGVAADDSEGAVTVALVPQSSYATVNEKSNRNALSETSVRHDIGIAAGALPCACTARPRSGLGIVWAPGPSTSNGWVAPILPHTKLVDVLRRRTKVRLWREPIVRDTLLRADYVRWRRARRLPRQFQPDNPIWWVVQSGEVRFTIEGQDAIVATKGVLVQVPYRNIYQLEAMGTAPALFFEVKVADSPTMYPADETPVPVPGMEFVKVRISGKATTATRCGVLDFMHSRCKP